MFMSTVSAGGGGGVSGSAAARVVPNNKRQRRVPLAFSLFTFLVFCQFIFLHSSSVSGAEAKVKLKPKGEEGKQTKPGNLTQTPIKNEEVRTRKKDSPKKTGDDDDENGSEGGNFWVGSHKLDFKPHPLLSPQISHSQSFHSEIPIIELGAESSLPSTDDDDVSESESSEEIRKKNKRRNRDRRKKARDQRKITHRTLWSRNATRDNPFLNMMNSPIIYGQHPIQQQGIMTGGSAPFLNRNDDSYHGSPTTWNLNHPGNGIQDNSGSPMQHFPQTNSLQQFQLAYQQQLQKMAHHHKFPQMMSLPGGGAQFSPSAPDTTADMMMNMNSFPPQPPPQQMLQQPLQSYGRFQSSMSSAPPGMGGSLSGSNGGPILVYVTPGGMAQTSSGPIPMKAYPPGDMPLMPYNHNHITEPVMEGLTHNPHAAPPPSGHNHNSQSGGTSNPQFLRNNFLRMFMDRLVSVGKVLPIPFVTKYSHSKPPPGHFNRRM